MENEKNAQSGVRERRYYTVKNKFDELLIAVCEDMQKEELEAFHAIEVKPVTGPILRLVKKDIKVFTWQRQSLRRFFYLQQQRWRYGQN